MMPQRLALAAAGLAAAVVLTVGLVAAGFAPTSSGQPVSAGLDEAADEALVEPSLWPEIVYVRPAPTPETIVLEKRASTAQSGSAGAGTGSVSSSRGERDDDERDGDERDDDDRWERREREDDEREDDDDDERERDERERDDD
ncbi:MAG TPA: hypothetical protein VK987_11110 [Anaerolineae bacterium]|nr:hypothetical protein [Anaerolineae bacterium]